jgi:hypothetical protein
LIARTDELTRQNVLFCTASAGPALEHGRRRSADIACCMTAGLSPLITKTPVPGLASQVPGGSVQANGIPSRAGRPAANAADRDGKTYRAPVP